MIHGADGEVETVVEDQAVRLGRRREGREHLGWVGGEDTKRDVQATEHRCRAHGCNCCSWASSAELSTGSRRRANCSFSANDAPIVDGRLKSISR